MNFERERWQAWKAVTDKITAREDYRYASPNIRLLINLARFAQTMLSKHNTAYWRNPTDDVLTLEKR